MLTVLDRGESEIEVRRDGDRVLVAPADLETVTGWQLKPEGLCRGPVCVPTRSRADLTSGTPGGDVDLAVFSELVGRPIAADLEAGVVAFGEAAPDVAESMRSLVAPDFTLPDLDGRPVSMHGLSDRKRLLLAWASW